MPLSLTQTSPIVEAMLIGSEPSSTRCAFRRNLLFFVAAFAVFA
jgi:hypothetical protein